MKKQVLFSVFFVVSIFFSANVFAQYPIASYDTPTAPGTYFTMSHATSPSMSAEKRKMNVNTTGGSSAPTSEFVTFMVYSLDMQDFKGPYTIQIGSSKSIPIDERQWGLVVLGQTGDCLMSVYTESNDTH
ncbi:MAG: hypothetical protein DRJ09_11210 [Bacteroidetes bacterium]|nr:MAG: hypothetical protein DRJ09_11210 [Bacteroidota bacterium]